MNLEPGKFYRTRSGGKAFVAAVGSPFEGAAKDSVCIGWVEGDRDATGWDRDGKWCPRQIDHGLDLIAEWFEPRTWTQTMHICELASGEIYATAMRETGGKLLARKTITITEGEGLDARP